MDIHFKIVTLFKYNIVVRHTLYAMGFCSSYSEVQRLRKTPQHLLLLTYTALLFAADNVDHNIITLDGKETFHGKGMIASITPGRQTSHSVFRRKIKQLKIFDLTQVDVKEYRFAKYARRNIKFEPLPLFNENKHWIDVLWETSFHFEACA